MKQTRTRTGTWTVPLLLGVASAIGLLSALFYDGWGDWISWISLTIPAVICLRPLLPLPGSGK